MMKPRVKICCISSLGEAQLAIRYGASALGLVSSMPSGPGVIDEDMIATITASAPPGVATFLLTSLQSADAIIAQQRRCGANTLQICDALTHGTYGEIRNALPGIGVVQVIHVRDEASVEEAKQVAAQGVHAILLDSGNQSLAIKELGGTGKTHDWNLSRRIVEAADVPVYLAGGLRASNVASAIQQVQPFGLDLCSSVRTNDQLDESKLAAFFGAVNGAV